MLVLAAVPTEAQDERPRWYGVDHGEQTRLVYGVPESDDTSLIFICHKRGQELSAYMTHPPLRAAAGQSLPVRLSNGRAVAAFRATVQTQEMDDLLHLKAQVPLDAPLESILAAEGQLTIDVGGVAARYPLDGVVAAARPLIALCGTAARAAPAADLTVTVTNKTRRRVEEIALREPDDIELNSDAFGYEGLAPGRRRTFTIPGGVCTYEISVLFEEKEEDCCSDPLPIGQQNLCDDPRIVVHD
ncbi:MULTISPECIES: hypothetical protein [Sphingopyxis]|uniref:Uncharacterized protein n=1 Tax=Sphingopyxis panaciterrulae TaxID=462372 RepID=A0A7W9B9A7_9SPHN|nr:MULTISPECIES: hypothetical protein [Sphingopyxis]MBB5708441.1 hypothetical protein [Sphingopyxis panaciterrulae]MCW0197641.1 hypothetical protein [Sphingopyxis sp.]